MAVSPPSRESAAHSWQEGQNQGPQGGFEHMTSGHVFPLSSYSVADLHSVQVVPRRVGLNAERKDKKENISSRTGR